MLNIDIKESVVISQSFGIANDTFFVITLSILFKQLD